MSRLDRLKEISALIEQLIRDEQQNPATRPSARERELATILWAIGNTAEDQSIGEEELRGVITRHVRYASVQPVVMYDRRKKPRTD